MKTDTKHSPGGPLSEAVDRAAAVLKRGGVILYPTDTVWGIGCDATDSAAVRKVYALKGSADKRSMLVLVDSPDSAARYTSGVPDVAWQMMEYSDTPLTLILPGGCGVAPELVPPEGTLGVRVPRHEFCSLLLRRYRRPLVSTSANLSGRPTPAGFDDISPIILDGVDFIVPRQFEKGATGRPSAIVSLGRGGEVKVIRM
ncbi:MAG: threonylcarbamoyl-AMP synthase [Rikenellaceae bacterium]|nr:threonylcarbamoyl-AMP synthase [Rikenellaceae bacterium]